MLTQPAPRCTTDFSLTDVSPWHEGQVLEVQTRSQPRPPGPWRVEGLLAEGGMAELYRVHHSTTGAEAVLKTPHRHHRSVARLDEALRFEAAWLEVLALSGTPEVLDKGTLEDGRSFYVMTLSPGQDLRRWITPGAPVLLEAVRVVRDAARVVARAHDRGVLHRDLKPSNIMRSPTGAVEVVDWGLAVAMDPEGPPAQRLVGTPAYLAPEVIAARPGAMMPTVDVWALGCTLVCLLEGRPPNPWNWASKSLDGLQAPREARPWQGDEGNAAEGELADIITASLHPDPALRTATAGHLAQALDTWLQGELAAAS